MRTHERMEGQETSVQRNTFVGSQLHEEQTWEEGLDEMLLEKLHMSREALIPCLEGYSRTREDDNNDDNDNNGDNDDSGQLERKKSKEPVWQLERKKSKEPV